MTNDHGETGEFRYALFGECLESQLRFPQLAAHPGGPARWSLRLDPALPSRPEGMLLGEAHMYDDVFARLFRDPTGVHWFEITDTGLFRISPDTADLRWRPTPEPSWDFARAHFLGGVMGTVMHLAGHLTLHASAVATEQGAIAFLAPKGSGKSTLAFALARSGLPLLSDDDLVVELDEAAPGLSPPIARPGVHAVRLTEESRERVGATADESSERYGKRLVRGLPDRSLATNSVPLAALYLLASRSASPGTPTARRRRLSSVEATMGLHGQEKAGVLLGGTHAPELLDRAARLARRAPVYALDVVRDFDRLPQVVSQIRQWHGSQGSTGS